MKLSELDKGQRAIIKDINLSNDLKQRLQSMGINKDEIIYVCRVGFLKGSFYIKTGCDSCIIISRNEAEHIEVELLKKGHQHRWGKKRKFLDNCETCCQEES